MTKKLSFLHTADLHLGAPTRGFRALDERWAARLQGAIAESYERVIRAALDRNVDFVVLAGDAFDTSRASYTDYLRFFEGMWKLHDAGIAAYLVGGNHDPYTSWTEDLTQLPPTAYFMGVGAPTFRLFEREGEPLCLIGARSYYNQTWSVDEDIAAGISRRQAEQALSQEHPRAAEAPFSIGIIHTGLELDASKAATSEEGLLNSDIDYWACGHLHRHLVKPSEANPRVVFPGCIQGRDIKESGERGCYLVELEKPHAGGLDEPHAGSHAGEFDGPDAGRLDNPHANARLEFIPTASVVLQSVKVDISTSRTLADLKRHVQTALFLENGRARCEEMVVRVTLTGQTELHEFLIRPDVLEGVRKDLNSTYPSFFVDALINRTQPVRDRAAQQREGLFPAIVMSIADDQRRNDQQMINYVQSEFVKRGVAIPGSISRRIAEFNDTAELLVLDLLERTTEDAGGVRNGEGDDAFDDEFASERDDYGGECDGAYGGEFATAPSSSPTSANAFADPSISAGQNGEGAL